VANLKSGDVSPVSAVLSASTVAHQQTRTLVCAGQTIEVSTSRYTGTATSATPALAGSVELNARSVYNTTTKLGWVEGNLKIRGADNRSSARFTAVNSDGRLDGWLSGSAGHGNGSLLGSIAGSFSRTGGLSGGQLGAGAGTNAAVLVKRIDCSTATTTRPSVHLTVRGQVDGLTATSISVKPADAGASQACAIADEKPSSRIAVGDRVEMTCAQVSGAWVLKKVRERD
jgi:hypothetical protein